MIRNLPGRLAQGGVMPQDADDWRPFDEVYRQFADPVYRFCAVQLGSLSAAEEVTSQTFTTAFAAYERLQPGSDVSPWLFRIARNAIVDQRRQAARAARELALLSGAGRAPALAAGELAEVRDDVRRLLVAAGSLPWRDRQLVGLRLGARMTFQEMALVTGRSPAAARRASERALARVRRAVGM
jgi:RNA polymerase sigma-70 factor (ECF subfamily)